MAAPGDDAGLPDANSRQEPDGWSSPIGVLADLCRNLAAAAGIDGTAVTVFSDSGARELVYASNALAQYLDEIQFTSGVGPCIDAFAAGVPVLCSDLEDDAHSDRWFEFADDARTAGIGSVFAFPLRGGPVVFGAVEVHRVRVGELSTEELDTVTAACDTIAAIVLAHFASLDDNEFTGAAGTEPKHTDGDDRLLESSFSRPQVNHAAGMVSVQLDVGVDDAMARMRARAYLEHRSIIDVADDVVSRRIRFNSADDTEADPGEQDR